MENSTAKVSGKNCNVTAIFGDTATVTDEEREKHEWLTVEAFAHLSGAPQRTIRYWCKKKYVECKKEGREWLVQAASLPHVIGQNVSAKSVPVGPDGNSPGNIDHVAADKIAALSQRIGYLEGQLETANRMLPEAHSAADLAREAGRAELNAARKRVGRFSSILASIVFGPEN